MEVDGGDAKEAEAATTADGRTAADLDAEDAEDEALLAEAIKKAQLGGGAGGEGTGGAVQMVEPPVDEEMLKQLLEFEFPEVRAKKALLAVGANLEAAINWITDHQDDADIDAPIPLVPMVRACGGWTVTSIIWRRRARELINQSTPPTHIPPSSHSPRPLTNDHDATARHGLAARRGPAQEEADGGGA